MALVFADGFDHYDTDDIEDKWDFRSSASSNAINSGTGQESSDSWRQTSGNYLQKSLDLSTVIVGFWFNFTTQSSSTAEILRFRTLADVRMGSVRYNNDQIDVINTTNAIVGTGKTFLRINDGGYYLEAKMTSGFEGSMEVRINGETIINVTGESFGTETIKKVWLGQSTSILGTVDYDDFYICDTTGSVNNDFLGPIHIETLLPNAVGTTNTWTPNTATPPDNWQDVDDNPPDDDTTYVSSSTVSNLDTYNFPSLAMTSGTIHGSQSVAYTRKEGVGERKISFAVESGATSESDQDEAGMVGIYKFKRSLYEVDPNTSSAWTVANFNAAEFGMKLTT